MPTALRRGGGGWTLPPPRKQSLRDYRVGVLLSDPQAEVEQSYQDAIAALARWLEGEGATVEMGAKPGFSTGEAMEVYTMLLRAATSKRLSDEVMAQSREELGRLPADALALPPPDAGGPDHGSTGTGSGGTTAATS